MTTLLQLGVYSHFLRKKTRNQQGTNRKGVKMKSVG